MNRGGLPQVRLTACPTGRAWGAIRHSVLRRGQTIRGRTPYNHADTIGNAFPQSSALHERSRASRSFRPGRNNILRHLTKGVAPERVSARDSHFRNHTRSRHVVERQLWNEIVAMMKRISKPRNRGPRRRRPWEGVLTKPASPERRPVPTLRIRNLRTHTPPLGSRPRRRL